MHGGGEQPVDDERGGLRLIGPSEDPGVLHLPVAAIGHHRCGGHLGRLALGVDDLGRRAGGVRDDDGTVATTTEGEVAVVGVAPRAGDLHPVLPQLLPVVDPTLAISGHGGQRESEPGGRRARVLNHEQVAVLRVGEIVEGGRGSDALGGEVGVVDVDAHIAEIDRRHSTIEGPFGELGAQRVGLGRGVSLEDVGVQGPRHEGVIHPEDDVGGRCSRGQDGSGHHRPRVTTGHQLQGDSRGCLEVGDDVVAERERVMGE